MSTLEEQHSADLRRVSLSTLVLVQSFNAEGKLGKSVPPQVLWYKASLDALKMAGAMHRLRNSNLILSFWAKGAASLASTRQTCSGPVSVTLRQICENIWLPLLTRFSRLSVSLAKSDITFMQLDQVMEECGDLGDGRIMRAELSLMSETLSASGSYKPEEDWVDLRLVQIQEYRQLQEAAAAASAMLSIARKMKLSGSFTEIDTLTQLVIVLRY